MTLPPADVHVELPRGALEREAMEPSLRALSPLFDGEGGNRCALFLASPDAGTHTALQFWRGALRAGVGLASPELFPWCLANAPAALIARHFNIEGPNATFLGGDEALDAACKAAERALGCGDADRVYVIHVVFGACPTGPRLRAWKLPERSR